MQSIVVVAAVVAICIIEGVIFSCCFINNMQLSFFYHFIIDNMVDLLFVWEAFNKHDIFCKYDKHD